MLSPEKKRKLRRSAHHLDPVVLVGRHGVTEPVMAEIDRALTDHELIKVRLRGMGRDERRGQVDRVARELTADVVGSIGAVAILFRENPEREPRRGAP